MPTRVGLVAHEQLILPTNDGHPARFDLKLEKGEKELLSQAAALMGTTMAGFVCAAAKKKARALLEQERRVTLTPRDFARVAATLPLPETPITKTFAQIDLAQGMRILH
jgi:uncharacterized protein (DUF1778 family)